eukprot:3362126-Pleurochrysis_carterae.AAC.1
MPSYTFSIWCECEGEALRAFAQTPLASWADVLIRRREGRGAVSPFTVKSLRRVCELNGYSYE